MALTDAQAGGRIREGYYPYKLTLTGTVVVGDAVTTAGVRALATVGTATQAAWIAGENGVSGDDITVFAAAIVDGRYSGGTVGARAYVAEGTDSGKITETAPATSGDVNTIIGTCIAADTYLLHPGVVGARSTA